MANTQTSAALPAAPIAVPGRERPRTPPRSTARARRALVRWGVPVIAIAGLAAAIARYEAAQPKQTVRYETAAVDHGPIAAKVTATGAVSALVTVQVGSQVSGRIETLSADFGSTVKKGQSIATIEPSLFKAALAQARANYVSAKAEVDRTRARRIQAERQFTRAKGLLAEGLMSRADYEVAEANLSAALADEAAANSAVAQTKAAVDQASLNLKYTTIISPIDGVVISRNVDVGQTVAAALQAPTLFTIAQDLTRMQVDTNVAEADVGKIHAGMPVTFTVDAYPQRAFAGTVRQVRDNAQTIQNVVTYDAVIDVDNTERRLKPGMTASVTFTYATRDEAIRLPNAALRFKPDPATLSEMTAGRPAKEAIATQPDRRTVWVVRGVTAEPVSVRIGISDGSSTEVLDGDVKAGDRAVVEASAERSKR